MTILGLSTHQPQSEREKIVAESNETIVIKPDMQVKHVSDNGSYCQKKLASIFDENGNGRYDKEEAENFNSYSFTPYVDQDGFSINKITAHKKGTDREITIRWDDVSDLESGCLNDNLVSFNFNIKNERGNTCANFGICGEDANLKVFIDMVEGNVTVSNADFKGGFISVDKIKSLLIKQSTEQNIKLSNETDKSVIRYEI